MACRTLLEDVPRHDLPCPIGALHSEHPEHECERGPVQRQDQRCTRRDHVNAAHEHRRADGEKDARGYLVLPRELVPFVEFKLGENRPGALHSEAASNFANIFWGQRFEQSKPTVIANPWVQLTRPLPALALIKNGGYGAVGDEHSFVALWARRIDGPRPKRAHPHEKPLVELPSEDAQRHGNESELRGLANRLEDAQNSPFLYMHKTCFLII